MVFTDDCVAAISASNGGLRCIDNPQWNGVSVGDRFVTYDRASDDPDINDVLYIGYFGTGAWATSHGVNRGDYAFYFTHNPGTAFEANMANYWTIFDASARRTPVTFRSIRRSRGSCTRTARGASTRASTARA